MITNRETVNKIATLRYNGYGVQSIAAILEMAVADVVAVVGAYKLKSWTEIFGGE